MPDTIFDVRDFVVVVTGGLGQLGQSYARILTESGARVAILDNKLTEVKTSEFGLCVPADVTSAPSLKKALAVVEDKLGTPRGLVNNAAIDSPSDAPASENGPYESYPTESFDRIMDVNIKGVHLCCQVFGSRMAEKGQGSIVNVSSIYGMVSPNQNLYEYRRRRGEDFYKPIAYSVSKSAIFNMSRYLATYWGMAGVRVNTVTLGGVFNDQDKEFVEEYSARVPLGRMARPEDYHGAIIFLLSDASSYMTGTNLVLDGGWTAW
jgi:NAD(P)-dependent dehydrogenase (short-subunit alcohol dehydrogenase family)